MLEVEDGGTAMTATLEPRTTLDVTARTTGTLVSTCVLLLVASAWLTARWLRAFAPVPHPSRSPHLERSTP